MLIQTLWSASLWRVIKAEKQTGCSQDGTTMTMGNRPTLFWKVTQIGEWRREETCWGTYRIDDPVVVFIWKAIYTLVLIFPANLLYVLDDGRIRASDGGLLLWVPPE